MPYSSFQKLRYLFIHERGIHVVSSTPSNMAPDTFYHDQFPMPQVLDLELAVFRPIELQSISPSPSKPHRNQDMHSREILIRPTRHNQYLRLHLLQRPPQIPILSQPPQIPLLPHPRQHQQILRIPLLKTLLPRSLHKCLQTLKSQPGIHLPPQPLPKPRRAHRPRTIRPSKRMQPAHRLDALSLVLAISVISTIQ